MDYLIFKALNFNMGGIEAALICYDVMCQWSVHMRDRVAGSMHLNIPDGVELRLGISLFHIHGHQDTCLARYSPSFIEGGQQIDGETIETLWAPLNEISRSTRGMSTSHRREVIDDHMNDSNWKKLVDLGMPPQGPSCMYQITAYKDFAVNTVSKCYRRALSRVMLSLAAFDNINGSARADSIAVWEAEEEKARKECISDVTVMDIYNIKMKKRGFDLSALILINDWLQSLLGQKCF